MSSPHNGNELEPTSSSITWSQRAHLLQVIDELALPILLLPPPPSPPSYQAVERMIEAAGPGYDRREIAPVEGRSQLSHKRVEELRRMDGG